MSDVDNRRRIIIDKKIKKWGTLFQWAAANNYDTLVLPLGVCTRVPKRDMARILKTAEHANLSIEAGGWELSSFVPRRLFFFHRDMFRMEQGRRTMRSNFCPTNPATIACLKKNAARALAQIARIMPDLRLPRVFHFWPDRAWESAWCSCPACRAFTPAEQNLIAVNVIADVLADWQTQARVSFLDLSENQAGRADAAGIRPRSAVFTVKTAFPCLSEKQ